MIDDKDIERLFEAAFWEKPERGFDDINEWWDKKSGWLAAFTLLLPIIQRQNEALRIYASGERWSHAGDDPLFFLWGNEELGYDHAREALAFVDEQLKKLGVSNDK